MLVKYPTFQIYFTGHSLGGAMTQLGALDFAQKHPEAVDRLSVYSFGQPRVGNLVFADYLDKQRYSSRNFRVSKYGDPIPYVPPPALGYVHHHTEYQIMPDGQTIRECVSNGKGGESSLCQFPPNQASLDEHAKGYFDSTTLAC